jgi:hypothetical protein
VNFAKSNWLHDFMPTKNKQYLSAFHATILFAPGCSTKSVNENLGGVATVSTLVVGLPLIPFALPFSAIEQNNERKNDNALYEKLGPIYEKRIETIKARSPKVDANEAWNENARAFLPVFAGEKFYPGLESAPFDSRSGEENQKQIDSNKLLTYLQTLLSDDPLEKQVHFWNDIVSEFHQARFDYEKEFNLEMYQKIQASKANGDAK